MPFEYRLWSVVLLFPCLVAGCRDEKVPLIPDNRGLPQPRQVTFAGDIYEAAPVYSPDGQGILFVSEAAGNRDIWYLGTAGGSARQLTRQPGADSAPTWSPDGDRYAFESDRGGHTHIWLGEAGSAGPRFVAVTAGGWDDGSPAWSPDGEQIVFESNRQKGRGTDLWSVALADGGIRRLTETAPGVYNRSADWAPDGSRVVFESDREAGESALYVLEPATGRVARLTDLRDYEGHPAWSPDGSQIAFESTREGPMMIYRIDSWHVGGESVTALARGYWPDWSPDGGEIIYGDFGQGSPNLWVVAVPRTTR